MINAGTTPNVRTRNYSLRALLLSVAAIACPLAICPWNLVLGTCLAIAVIGIIIAIMGVQWRQRAIAALGLAIACGGMFFSAQTVMSVIAWVGHHQLDVHLHVVDGESLVPISGASVEILRGPPSPLEGYTPKVSVDFVSEGDMEGTLTDEHGSLKFSHRFFAAGTDGTFGDSGYIDTSRYWLTVTRSGYSETWMPLDRQSARPRDIADKTPLYVTVPMGKR